MSWSVHTHKMKTVNSLARATTVWNDAESFPKSVHTSWRPLDSRRQQHKRMVKLGDDRGYECVLYNTAMVTYFADGHVALRCYDSPSSQQFAWKVEPTGCKVTSHKGKMYWEVNTDDGPRFYREGAYPLILAPTAKGNWLLANEPDVDYEMAYDRKLGARVQKQLRPYATWHKVVERMGVKTMRPGYVCRGHVEGVVPHLGDVSRYPDISKNLGAPENFLEHLYIIAGAKYKSPVPYDRLPRN